MATSALSVRRTRDRPSADSSTFTLRLNCPLLTVVKCRVRRPPCQFLVGETRILGKDVLSAPTGHVGHARSVRGPGRVAGLAPAPRASLATAPGAFRPAAGRGRRVVAAGAGGVD